jgi:hypothetical protein
MEVREAQGIKAGPKGFEILTADTEEAGREFRESSRMFSNERQFAQFASRFSLGIFPVEPGDFLRQSKRRVLGCNRQVRGRQRNAACNVIELMKKTLVVVTDLGCFKAFRLDDNHFNTTPRLELLEEFNNAEADSRLVNKVTDFGGRFPRATGTSNVAGSMSDGERHNIELERRKRLVRQLAGRVNSAMRTSGAERCFLAASKEINRQLLEELDPNVRTMIEKIVPADLTKVDKADLLRHFAG